MARVAADPGSRLPDVERAPTLGVKGPGVSVEARMNPRALISLAAVLFVVWLLAVVAFKVAGALIHLLLIAAAVLFISSLVVSAGGRRRVHP